MKTIRDLLKPPHITGRVEAPSSRETQALPARFIEATQAAGRHRAFWTTGWESAARPNPDYQGHPSSNTSTCPSSRSFAGVPADVVAPARNPVIRASNTHRLGRTPASASATPARNCRALPAFVLHGGGQMVDSMEGRMEGGGRVEGAGRSGWTEGGWWTWPGRWMVNGPMEGRNG